jgi:Zn-dependent protease with chaperone function
MTSPHVKSAQDDAEFGEWFYKHIADAFLVKHTEWVDGIAARLQSGRSQAERREVVVVGLSDMTAFTVPGRYIYVTGRLIEYCPGEAALAFVIGHELAHHDLDHMQYFPRWFRDVGTHWVTEIIFLAVHGVQRMFFSPEREGAADRHALDLCRKAGYEAADCLQLFDQLESRLLDLGDVAGVYGPQESEDELLPNVPLITKLRLWAWQRTRGYLPVRDRRRALEEYLAEHGGGSVR